MLQFTEAHMFSPMISKAMNPQMIEAMPVVPEIERPDLRVAQQPHADAKRTACRSA